MLKHLHATESQVPAARWRSTTFKSIYKHFDSDAISEGVRQITQIIFQSGLKPLINFVLGEQAGTVFEAKHYIHVEDLVRDAWKWNTMLKGDVLALGDFAQTYYEAGSRFNSQLMAEFDAKPGGPAPGTMIATLALGLDSSRAIGDNRLPEVAHVCKALVVTESALYG